MPYRPPKRPKKKDNNLFSSNGTWKIQSCEVTVDECEDGTTKTTKSNRFFDDDENCKSINFENFMNCEFDENDLASGNASKSKSTNMTMEVELVQEKESDTCCVIL